MPASLRSVYEANKDRIITNYMADMSIEEIARQVGVHGVTLGRYIKRWGVDRSRFDGWENRSLQLADDIVAMWQKGSPVRTISERLGIKRAIVARRLTEAGIDVDAPRVYRYTPECDGEIVALYRAGFTATTLAEQYEVCFRTIKRIIIENGLTPRNRGRRLYERNDNYFEKITDEAHAYMLGWYYSDGCNVTGNQGISIGLIDREMVEWVRGQLGYTGPIYTREPQTENGKPFYILGVCSRKLSNDLEALGCPPAKSLILKYPDVSVVPKHLQKHFIRGYFEGDGSLGCYTEHNTWSLNVVGTRHMLEGILDAVGCHGCWQKINPETNEATWLIGISKSSCVWKFLTYIYGDATYYLRRKYDRYLQYLEWAKAKRAEKPHLFEEGFSLVG